MSSSETENDDHVDENERIPVPMEFFKYVGAARKDGNSLYVCQKCAKGSSKTISCSDRSRLNLKKHMKVYLHFT